MHARAHEHTRTHARTHARSRARAHTHTHAHTAHTYRWAPKSEDLQQRDMAYIRIDDWMPHPNSAFLEQWACARVGAYLEPLSAALAPIKTSDKVSRHSAHVLLELGMRAFIFYLEAGVFHELEAKAADLCKLKGSEILSPGTIARVEAFREQLPSVRESMRASAHRYARQYVSIALRISCIQIMIVMTCLTRASVHKTAGRGGARDARARPVDRQSVHAQSAQAVKAPQRHQRLVGRQKGHHLCQAGTVLASRLLY